MDIITILPIAVALIGLLYVAIFGQMGIPEWIRRRRAIKDDASGQNTVISPLTIPPHTILHNLPHRGDFIGREKEKRQVHEALKSRSYIVMIDGIGGIGKTSLALQVLHECLEASQNSKSVANDFQKFDALIWTSAKDRELTINDVLDTIARTLEYPALTQLALADKQHEIIKRLQEKPYLLIVDNFETITDDGVAEFLRKLPEPSKCLVTSRVQNLRQAHAVSLRGMEREEALLLIKNEGIRLGLALDALIEDKQNFQRLYEATGGAPLAIRWSIGQIKQRGQSIDSVLNSLHGARGDIFEFIFKRAWSLLSESAIKILMIMPVFASSASKAAIEAASDLHNWELDDGLGQLVELWLLESNEKLEESKRRYNLHPLTRAFAQSRLSDNSALEHQVRVKLAELFESFAKAAGGDRWGTWEKYDEIEEEKDNIFALISWSFANGEALAGMKLGISVTFFMSLRGYLYESVVFGRRAIDTARQQGNTTYLAWYLISGIGWAEIRTGNLENAEVLIREGLEIYENIGDHNGIKDGLYALGRALLHKKDFIGARQCYERGMTLAKTSPEGLAVERFQRELSLLAASEGRLVEAKEGLESLVPVLKQRDQILLASTLENLAYVNRALKNYDSAFKVGIKGLEMAQKIKRRDTIARISMILANTEFQRNKYQSALTFAQQASELFERSGMFPKESEEMERLINELQAKLSN